MMKRLSTANRSSNRAIEVLCSAFPELLAIYRFGSAGTEYERPDSDVDFAFLARRAEDAVLVWDTAQQVAIELGCDVDLIDLRQASTVVAANIVAFGARLYCTDADECAEFEAHTLADYARLNEERCGILQDIQARGRVHAG